MSWRKDIKYLKHNFKYLHSEFYLSKTELTLERAQVLKSHDLITLIPEYNGDYFIGYTDKGFIYTETFREHIALSIWTQFLVPTFMLIIGIVIGHLIK
ncbi:hypothetical protein KII93_00325 [Leuconostoc gelidum subsp. gasicomitatum]|uniref:hypothetical protein n=1 Tax=Leuconostoc gasicomitatum TaxID=115778 RepID=UPI0007E20441|nr:hypothetical protein [Leuconostoc gasicomitatum]MBZ5946931.1 hypothetical protein [Leuconostoc gasicomitatum]CUW09218.1 hypothetical protein PB1E_1043 [Leuconostoc gasicomitatum]